MIADIYLAIIKSKYLEGIDTAIGAEFLDENASPPRMVWVPTADEFEFGGGVRAVFSQPKTPVLRNAGVRIRVWGKASDSSETVDDIRATEQLLNRVIVALSDCAHGSVAFNSAEWVAADGQEVAQYGRAIDLNVTFKVPVVRDMDVDGITTAPITSLPADSMTGTADFPPAGTSGNDLTGTPAP